MPTETHLFTEEQSKLVYLYLCINTEIITLVLSQKKEEERKKDMKSCKEFTYFIYNVLLHLIQFPCFLQLFANCAFSMLFMVQWFNNHHQFCAKKNSYIEIDL